MVPVLTRVKPINHSLPTTHHPSNGPVCAGLLVVNHIVNANTTL